MNVIIITTVASFLSILNPHLKPPHSKTNIHEHNHKMCPNPALYKNHKIIQVNTKNKKELDQLLDTGVRSLSCRVNIGINDFIVNDDQMKAIKNLGFKTRVKVENISDLIKQNNKSRINNKNRGENYYSDYRTMPEIIQKLDQIASINPLITERFSIGLSYEGREIEAIRISTNTNENKPAIILNGCQHAREWISTMVPVFIAEEIITNYQTDPLITNALNLYEIVIVPVVNPDGYIYSYTNDRYWRKNRRDNDGSSCYGVDTNRNWSVDWAGGQSTSSNPCSDIYVGEEPLSEPENIAMDALFASYSNVAAHIDFHSYGQLILQPWAHTNELAPDHDELDTLGEQMTQAISNETGAFYPHGNGDAGGALYLASGTMEDFSYGEYGALGYTIELRGSSFELPQNQIIPTCQENYAAVKSMLSFGSLPSASGLSIYCEPNSTCNISLSGNPPYGTNGSVNFEIQTLPENGFLLVDTIPVSSLPFFVDSFDADIEYIPNTDFEGEDSFSYVSLYNNVSSPIAEVEIQIGVPAYPDDCIGAEIVENGTFEFSTVDATNSINEYNDDLCPGTYLGEMSQDVWFKYVSCLGGNLTISTCNTIDFDSDIVIYKGIDCNSLEQVGCNGDGNQCAGYSSEVDINVDSNTTYYIRVGGWSSSSSGSGLLEIDGPPNDTCIPDKCLEDLNDDTIVNTLDLLFVISNFGSTNNTADINNDGIVNTFDLLLIVSSFGICE